MKKNEYDHELGYVIEKALAKIGIYIQFQPFIIQFDNAD